MPLTLVLASNSPRRRELLALGGWKFTVRPMSVDESQLPGEAPGEYVLRLARLKARECMRTAREGEVVLAADTSVVLDGDILGKPADAADAVSMLERLRGRTHQVYTGLAALRVADAREVLDLCVTDVPMRAYSDEELKAYAESQDPLDKAGAYAIQHSGVPPVEKMAGCFASVMGLPLCHLVRSLRRLEILPARDVPAACQSTLNYQCPISSAVLRGETVG